MKKLVSLILAGALTAAMTLMAGAAAEPTEAPKKASYTATKAGAAITIDGKMDDAYKNAEVVKLDNKQMIDLLADEKDLATGEMRILWDDAALYVYAVINDATYAPPYANVAWWDNVDSFWVATDANADLSKTNCYAFARAGSVMRKLSEDSADVEWVVKNMKDGKEVTMGSYGNAEGNYLANTPKPEGAVDSYVVEIKIPYTGAKVGGKGYFGAFLADDMNFLNADPGTVNQADGRSRTSEAVSTDTANGIWQVTGSVDEGKVPDAKLYFDDLTFRDIPSSGDNNGGDSKPTTPSTGDAVSVAVFAVAAGAGSALLISRKRKTR